MPNTAACWSAVPLGTPPEPGADMASMSAPMSMSALATSASPELAAVISGVPVRIPPTGSPPLVKTALNLRARPGGRVPDLHRELVAPTRLRRRPGILIDHQPGHRHRVLGELDDPHLKPTPGRHLQAHGKEQP